MKTGIKTGHDEIEGETKMWSELEVLSSNAKDLEDGMDRGCDG